MLGDWDKLSKDHYRSKNESEQPIQGGKIEGKSEVFYTQIEDQCYIVKQVNDVLIWKHPQNSRTATHKAIINYVKAYPY